MWGFARLLGRLLVVIAVAVVAGGLLAEAVGAKTRVVYSNTVEVGGEGGPEAAAVMVWSLTSRGMARVDFEGAQTVYYIVVRGDPTRLIGETSKVGIGIEEQEIYHDFRGGVVIAHAVLRANPLLIAGIISSALMEGQAVQANGTLEVELDTRESVVAVALPSQGSERVSYSVEYRILGYERSSPESLAVFSMASAAVGSALIYAARRAEEADRLTP